MSTERAQKPTDDWMSISSPFLFLFIIKRRKIFWTHRHTDERRKQPTAPLYMYRVSMGKQRAFIRSQRMVGGEATRSSAREKNFNAIIIFFMKKLFFLLGFMTGTSASRSGWFIRPVSLRSMRRDYQPWLPSGAGPVLRQAGKMKKWEKGKRRRRRNPINFTFFFFSLFKPSGSFLLKLQNLMNTKYFSRNVALLLHIFISFASFPFRVVLRHRKHQKYLLLQRPSKHFLIYFMIIFSFFCLQSFIPSSRLVGAFSLVPTADHDRLSRSGAQSDAVIASISLLVGLLDEMKN